MSAFPEIILYSHMNNSNMNNSHKIHIEMSEIGLKPQKSKDKIDFKNNIDRKNKTTNIPSKKDAV